MRRLGLRSWWASGGPSNAHDLFLPASAASRRARGDVGGGGRRGADHWPEGWSDAIGAVRGGQALTVSLSPHRVLHRPTGAFACATGKSQVGARFLRMGPIDRQTARGTQTRHAERLEFATAFVGASPAGPASWGPTHCFFVPTASVEGQPAWLRSGGVVGVPSVPSGAGCPLCTPGQSTPRDFPAAAITGPSVCILHPVTDRRDSRHDDAGRVARALDTLHVSDSSSAAKSGP